MSERPFTQVKFKGPATQRYLSYDAFLSLPIHERIRHILARDIEFLRGDETVDWREALAWLRTRAAQEK